MATLYNLSKPIVIFIFLFSCVAMSEAGIEWVGKQDTIMKLFKGVDSKYLIPYFRCLSKLPVPWFKKLSDDNLCEALAYTNSSFTMRDCAFEESLTSGRAEGFNETAHNLTAPSELQKVYDTLIKRVPCPLGNSIWTGETDTILKLVEGVDSKYFFHHFSCLQMLPTQKFPNLSERNLCEAFLYSDPQFNLDRCVLEKLLIAERQKPFFDEGLHNLTAAANVKNVTNIFVERACLLETHVDKPEDGAMSQTQLAYILAVRKLSAGCTKSLQACFAVMEGQEGFRRLQDLNQREYCKPLVLKFSSTAPTVQECLRVGTHRCSDEEVQRLLLAACGGGQGFAGLG